MSNEKEELKELINLLYSNRLTQYGKRKLCGYIEKLQEENDILQTNYEILQGEMDRIGISILGLEAGNSTDDVIDEIKNLQKELEQEKEKNKDIANDLEKYKRECYLQGRNDENKSMLEVIKRHYISKDKIRAKIEELNKTIYKGAIPEFYAIYRYTADVLEELLEE